MKKIILGIIALVILGAGGYFFWQNQNLSGQLNYARSQIAETKEAKSKVENELVVLKNTNLAKENEILRLKLKTAEKDLIQEKEAFSQFRSRVASIPQITDALSLITSLVFADDVSQCPSQFGRFGEVRQKIVAMGDTRLLNAWDEFAKSPDPAHCGMVPKDFQRVMNLGLDKILGSTK